MKLKVADNKTTDAREEKNRELEALLQSHLTRILVVGCGGGGNNTISRLVEVGVEGVETLAINTDAQDLLLTNSDDKILIGKNITKGLGGGSDPKVGEESARENQKDISTALEKTDMVFVTCGLGGGTGTGSAPIVAEAAKKAGALTIGVVTLPFWEEGVMRWENARSGLENMRKNTDTIIIIPNDKLLDAVPDLPLSQAFKVADDILVNAVRGITELVTGNGLVNLDFADVRAIMANGGPAMIGIGEAEGEGSAQAAAELAMQNPLLDLDIAGARNALINVTGGRDMSLKDARIVMKTVAEKLDPSAKVIWGANVDSDLGSVIRVMLIVTGFSSKRSSTGRLDTSVSTQTRQLQQMTQARATAGKRSAPPPPRIAGQAGAVAPASVTTPKEKTVRVQNAGQSGRPRSGGARIMPSRPPSQTGPGTKTGPGQRSPVKPASRESSHRPQPTTPPAKQTPPQSKQPAKTPTPTAPASGEKEERRPQDQESATAARKPAASENRPEDKTSETKPPAAAESVESGGRTDRQESAKQSGAHSLSMPQRRGSADSESSTTAAAQRLRELAGKKAASRVRNIRPVADMKSPRQAKPASNPAAAKSKVGQPVSPAKRPTPRQTGPHGAGKGAAAKDKSGPQKPDDESEQASARRKAGKGSPATPPMAGVASEAAKKRILEKDATPKLQLIQRSIGELFNDVAKRNAWVKIQSGVEEIHQSAKVLGFAQIVDYTKAVAAICHHALQHPGNMTREIVDELTHSAAIIDGLVHNDPDIAHETKRHRDKLASLVAGAAGGGSLIAKQRKAQKESEPEESRTGTVKRTKKESEEEQDEPPAGFKPVSNMLSYFKKMFPDDKKS